MIIKITTIIIFWYRNIIIMPKYLVRIQLKIFLTNNIFPQYYVVSERDLKNLKYLNTNIECYGCGSNRCFVCVNGNSIGVKYVDFMPLEKNHAEIVKFVCQKKFQYLDLNRLLDLLEKQNVSFSDDSEPESSDSSSITDFVEKTTIEKITDLYNGLSINLEQEELVEYVTRANYEELKLDNTRHYSFFH